MSTRFILLGQYDGAAVLPIDRVCRDYFQHLTPAMLARKILLSEVRLPLIRIECGSQKAAKGVHLNDLADWNDARRAAATKELAQMTGDR